MSLAALSETSSIQPSVVTAELLRDVARRNGFVIPSRHEDAYLLGLRSAHAIATEIYSLPDYIDPRLLPVPTKDDPREHTKPDTTENDLNAWCHLTLDMQAEHPTSQLLQGRAVAVKDTIAVGHIPQTLGTFPQFVSSTPDRYPRSQIDATVVQRLLLAGAKIKGTSTCENYSLSPMSYTSASGPVHNPWQRGYNSGGSSSGSAALVALGTAREAGVKGLENAGPSVDIGIGGDQAGSIRVPAAYCGIYGLKPTFGLVPYTGVASLIPMTDYVGPLARTIEDIALSLTAMAGYDGLDPRMGPESPLRQEVIQYHEELAKFVDGIQDGQSGDSLCIEHCKTPELRVGLIKQSFKMAGMSPEVADVVKTTAIKHFSVMGASVSEVSIPMHSIGSAIWTAAVRNQMASLAFGGRATDMLAYDLPHLSLRWPSDQEMYDLLSHHNPAVIVTILGETLLSDQNILPAAAQKKAHRHVLQLQAAYDAALQEFDVLVTPTTLGVAPPLPNMQEESRNGPGQMDNKMSSVEKKLRLAAGSINNSAPFNATGHPALNVPCGWGTAADGVVKLPVGMQIIGKRFHDLDVMKAAKLFGLGGGGLGPRPL